MRSNYSYTVMNNIGMRNDGAVNIAPPAFKCQALATSLHAIAEQFKPNVEGLSAVTNLLFLLILAGRGFDNSIKESPSNAMTQNGLMLLFMFSLALTHNVLKSQRSLHADAIVAAQTTLVGMLVLAASMGMGWRAPQFLGAESTASWVSQTISPTLQVWLEQLSYTLYPTAAALLTAGAYIAQQQKTLNSNYPVVVGVSNTLMSGALYEVVHGGMVKFAAKRPRAFAMLATSIAETMDYSFGAINSVGTMKSCQNTLLTNFPSGHSFAAAIPLGAILWARSLRYPQATQLEKRMWDGLLALTLLGAPATALLRVLSDCHTSEAALAGMLLGVITGINAPAMRELAAAMVSDISKAIYRLCQKPPVDNQSFVQSLQSPFLSEAAIRVDIYDGQPLVEQEYDDTLSVEDLGRLSFSSAVVV